MSDLPLPDLPSSLIEVSKMDEWWLEVTTDKDCLHELEVCSIMLYFVTLFSHPFSAQANAYSHGISYYLVGRYD